MRDGNSINRTRPVTVAFTPREYAQLAQLLAAARESESWTGRVTLSEIIRYAISELHCAVCGVAAGSPKQENEHGTQANAG